MNCDLFSFMQAPRRLASRQLLLLLLPLWLAGCGGQPSKPDSDVGTTAGGGGYYQDDGPAGNVPVDLASVPDAQPRDEPLHRYANNPYTVMGQRYVPQKTRQPHRQRGVASWYGRKYHGRKTASGETYDMFAMTAAHPTLPIPSFVRVTRPDTGKSVVVRVNDRGPFINDRIIDLSYTAAWKLGLIGKGSGLVDIETVLPGEESMAAEQGATTPVMPAAAVSSRALPPVSAGAPVTEANTNTTVTTPVAINQAPPAEHEASQPAAAGGQYLQLGAFGQRENAEKLRSQLQQTLGDMGQQLQIRDSNGLYRVQLGPWSSETEARAVAEQLQSVHNLSSVLAK